MIKHYYFCINKRQDYKNQIIRQYKQSENILKRENIWFHQNMKNEEAAQAKNNIIIIMTSSFKLLNFKKLQWLQSAHNQLNNVKSHYDQIKISVLTKELKKMKSEFIVNLKKFVKHMQKQLKQATDNESSLKIEDYLVKIHDSIITWKVRD